MNYVNLTVGNKDYKLRLNTRNIVNLEKQLGCNPINIFGDGDKIPTITEMVNVLYASLQQLEHGITLNDAYDIFDAYLEEHNSIEFVSVIVDVYKMSGIIRNDIKGEETKN